MRSLSVYGLLASRRREQRQRRQGNAYITVDNFSSFGLLRGHSAVPLQAGRDRRVRRPPR